jgi:two-component system, cell cycle sensor histidine kinase and response regulator CckA
VSSAPGAGSTFTVLLPESAMTHHEPEGTKPARAAHEGAVGTERVLVAEDEAGVRSLVTRILRRRGFDVIEAADGRAALDILRDREQEVDLLISDVHMPELDGPDLIAAGRTLRPDLRVLVISGSPEEGAATTVPYLAKPFTAGQLLGRVREVLDA